MEKRLTRERGAVSMCKQSPSVSLACSAGDTYTAFLDALLTNVCCADNWTSDDADSKKDFVVSDRVMGGASTSLINDNVNEDGNKSNSMCESTRPTTDTEPLAESILPHLRFNPLNDNSATPISSLDEFFNLFLRDDAPHSFLSFHKSKGDEEIKATPWKLGQEDDQLERTISFITKFTPKNLQEPHNKDVAAPSASSSTKTITDINNPTLTLAVTSHQTLSRQPSTMILESRLSFDFVDYSLHKTSLSKMLNLSLTQFLISNDVKGSEVNVRVVLKEEDGGIASTATPATANGDQSVIHPFLLPNRLISLSEDPLTKNLLEGDNHDDGVDNYKGFGYDIMSGNPCNIISPTHIGASLLSAIRERNCPTPPNSSPKRSSDPVDEAALLIAKHSESITTTQKRPESSPSLQKDIADGTYDILRTASSRGSLKFKHVTSFEAASPGEMSMRRMLWEKDRSGNTRGGTSGRVSGGDLQSFDAPARGGLSMHIEMDVRDSSNSTNNNATVRNRTSSFSNSSFQRSRSNGIGGQYISYIEEKVRKGIKKRVARSWITWANSWCCRLWEDEQMERFLKKGTSAPSARKRSNTRPTVRRIGERRKSPARIAKKQTAPNDVELDMLSAMQKQIESAESMKPRRVVTPTSSPVREDNISVWFPLNLKNGDPSCRWMSSEDEGGQYGVEVCTIVTPVDNSTTSEETERKTTPLKELVRLKSKST